MSNVQPIFILPEGTERSQGKSAQRNNIMAARAVADTVRTTLGPKGMDKMLIDTMGDVIVTNDGVTILKEMSVQHPSAKLIVEVAKTQEAEVGDGTTTAVVIAGELLKKAESLIEQDIHPTVISKGFMMAEEKAQEMLAKLGEPIAEKDTALLEKIAETAMTGKGAEGDRASLARIAIEAVKQVAHSDDDKLKVSLDDIKVEKRSGGRIEDSELIKGVLVDKERLHEGMPERVEKARLALVDIPIEVKSTEIDAKIQIEEPGQLQAFLAQEESMLRSMVEKIARSGANVVFCQKGIDDMAQHFLAKKGIYGARRVKKSDMERLAAATGAKITSNLDELTDADLGFAGVVEEAHYGDEAMTVVRECPNPKSVTILIRGSTNHVIDEIKRAMDDAIGDLAASLVVGKVVAGAGSTEIELSRGLRRFAESLSGREQLAVMAFADALEIIPKTLAENGGLDPIDIMTELKSQHEKGSKWAGVDVNKGAVMDAWKAGVIEPLKIKTQCLSSATEVAMMVLRIDDVIAAGGSGEKGPKMPGPEGMPPY